jgi:preprotein translocase subunit YajC
MRNIFVLLQAQAEGENTWMSLLPLFLILVVFYFFFIRPQTKKSKEQKKFRDSLTKGDKVITIGGVHGRVNDVKENTVILEIADNVRVTVEKSALVANPGDVVQTK